MLQTLGFEYTGLYLDETSYSPKRETYELQEKGITFTTIENYFDDLEYERKIKELSVLLIDKQIRRLNHVLSYAWLYVLLTFLSIAIAIYEIIKFIKPFIQS